jgi:hypothetical protein
MNNYLFDVNGNLIGHLEVMKNGWTNQTIIQWLCT